MTLKEYLLEQAKIEADKEYQEYCDAIDAAAYLDDEVFEEKLKDGFGYGGFKYILEKVSETPECKKCGKTNEGCDECGL